MQTPLVDRHTDGQEMLQLQEPCLRSVLSCPDSLVGRRCFCLCQLQAGSVHKLLRTEVSEHRQHSSASLLVLFHPWIPTPRSTILPRPWMWPRLLGIFIACCVSRGLQKCSLKYEIFIQRESFLGIWSLTKNLLPQGVNTAISLPMDRNSGCCSEPSSSSGWWYRLCP